MIPDRDFKMVAAMRKYGGGFVQQLAELLRRADLGNYARIEEAFPEIFTEYRKIGATMRDEEFH